MHYINKFNSVEEAMALGTLKLPQLIMIDDNDNRTRIQCSQKDNYKEMEITVDASGNLKPKRLYPGLRFTAVGASTIGLTNNGGNTPDMKYSLDNGQNWTTWNYSSISLTNGQTICFKGNNPNGFSSSTSKYSQFIMTGSIKAAGNIMSLIDDGACNTMVIPCNYCYYNLFYNCTALTSAPILPSTTLANRCYWNMFSGCTSLTSAPELLATTLAEWCYRQMFENCTSLTSAPELPATTLVSNCYQYMFYGCTALISAPELPATTLAGSCYNSMFYGCSSLTSAPELPATTLASDCYNSMFRNCTSLTSAPELPATTLASDCYSGMFQGCSKLTSAPELPATTLVNGCYNSMFKNCSQLSYIKCLATDISAIMCLGSWVNGVSATGTFVKATSMSSWPIGTDGIPSNWTVQDAA